MSHGMVLQTAVSFFLGLSITLSMSGCGTEGYPENLTYPLRTDPLVIKLPEKQPDRPEPPGRFEQTILHLPELGGQILLPEKLTAAQRAELSQALNQQFGTPAHPRISGLENDAASLLDLSTLAAGARVYRDHCLHCHGLPGDGRGPTAPWVQPHPRDFRQGIFKFTTSSQPAGVRKPLRRDLLQILRQGIEGTSMPSFALLDERELQAVTSYVIHLSLRGQAEFEVMADLLTDNGEGDIRSSIEESWRRNMRYWNEAELKPLVVPDPPAYAPADLDQSLRRGYRQFLTGTAQCVKCHGDFGRANDYFFDAWGTINRPTRLTSGVYRGGGRPEDLYARIHSGINGSGMPAYDALPPSDLWDIVHFLRALPYPQRLPEDLRQTIYGKKESAL